MSADEEAVRTEEQDVEVEVEAEQATDDIADAADEASDSKQMLASEGVVPEEDATEGDKAPAEKHEHPLLHLIGPAYARRKDFWVSIVYSTIPQGIIMALVALAFYNIFEQLSKATWLTHEYEEALEVRPSDEHGGEEPHSIDILRIGQGQWWYVGLLAAGGACVGLIKVIWTFLLFKKHPFPDQPPGLLHELKELSPEDPLVSIPVWCCSALSIGFGASAGPEAAMGAVGCAFGSAVVARKWDSLMKYIHKSTSPVIEHNGEVASYLFPDLSDEQQMCALDGLASAFGALFPSQYLSPMLIHELGFLWGSEKRREYHFMETVVRTGIGASVSYTLFVGLQNLTFLQEATLPQAAYDLLPTIDVVHMGYAAVLGIISGFLGLLGFLVLGVCGAAGKKVNELLNNLGTKWLCLPPRFLGMLMTPIIGGCLVGLLAVACPLTLGDGAHQLGAVVILGHELGADDVVATMFAKLGAVGLSLGFGFVGGQIFPLLFSGTCLGVLANLWVPDVPILVAVPSCMVAVPCAFMPALFTLTTTASMVLALGGAATSPVFLASILSWTTVCGVGTLQDLIAKSVDGDVPQDEPAEDEEQVSSSLAPAKSTHSSLAKSD